MNTQLQLRALLEEILKEIKHTNELLENLQLNVSFPKLNNTQTPPYNQPYYGQQFKYTISNKYPSEVYNPEYKSNIDSSIKNVYNPKGNV